MRESTRSGTPPQFTARFRRARHRTESANRLRAGLPGESWPEGERHEPQRWDDRGGRLAVSTPPSRAVLEGRIGWPPGESRAEVRSQIEETIAEAAANDDWLADHPPTVEWFGWQAEPHEVDSDGELATLAKRVGEDVTGRSGSFVGGNAGLDERFYDLYYDVDAVSVGPTGSNLHGADEHTTVPSLLETATTIASIAIEYCGNRGVKGNYTPRFPPESIDQTNRKKHHHQQHTMTTDITVYWDDQMLDHEPPKGAFKFPFTPIVAVPEVHPTRRERVQNIRAMLDHAFGDIFETVSPDPASRKAIERVHDPDYLDWLVEFCADGGGRIEDTTTGLNEHTYDAARVSARAAIAAAGQALDGSKDDGQEALPYALCRPSGHHAQPDCADGFCYLNNVALAAEAALATDGPADITADRVAIIDWDVHHGNGTQETFYDRDDVLFVSAHNDHGSWHPEYHPQEGSIEEFGEGDGEGYTLNVPLPPGTGNRGYEAFFERIVNPAITGFDPDLIPRQRWPGCWTVGHERSKYCDP